VSEINQSCVRVAVKNSVRDYERHIHKIWGPTGKERAPDPKELCESVDRKGSPPSEGLVIHQRHQRG
jgi:hypothetical protein